MCKQMKCGEQKERKKKYWEQKKRQEKCGEKKKCGGQRE